jgi:hypothetical protein
MRVYDSSRRKECSVIIIPIRVFRKEKKKEVVNNAHDDYETTRYETITDE